MPQISPSKPRPEFSKPQDVGPRPWGTETLIAHIPGVATGKLLHMNKGAKGGLQKHRIKYESQYVLSGRLLVRYQVGDDLAERVMEQGECILIPPGAVHQEEALTDVTLIEVSNPVFNDRVRVEEDFGLTIPEGGLPSTTLEEVEVR